MDRRNEAEFLEELLNNSDDNKNSREYVDQLATKHGVRAYHAENVWSFYAQKEGKVKLCTGLPCNLMKKSAGKDLLKKYPPEEIVEVSCLGYCDHAPVAWSDGKYYQIGNAGMRELDIHLKNPGFSQVESLQEFLDSSGFNALVMVLNRNDRDSILQLVDEFNLKGFGGSGFPAYVKWKAVSSSGEQEKYLLVNAHEGEPGTFKDRILMESKPFDLIEASLITAFTVGASNVIIALKHEYVEAEQVLKKALADSKEYLIEKFGITDLPGVRIIRVPGYYITGEESALMEAIEGRRSEPRLRPPYPAEAGLYGKPTLIDNVETLLYFLGRLREYNKNGSQDALEKAYCLTGDVKNPGSYLLKYGSPAVDLITQKGGTALSELKAVFPGGLSGGILPAEKGGINLDFDSVKSAGAGMGTGAMIAISKERCMVDVMESVEKFFEGESCGKCMPCRFGTQELSGLFGKLKHGTATNDDIQSALKTADVMLKGSICGLGQASARMYLDLIKYFKGEVEEHVSGNCPSNVCFQEAR